MAMAYNIANAIRRAFRESGMTMVRLSELSGVRYSGVHRIIVGTGDITTATASKLLAALGLQIVATKRKGK